MDPWNSIGASLLGVEPSTAERIVMDVVVDARGAQMKPVLTSAAVEAVERLGDLEEDWDLDWAPAIDPDALFAASRFVKSMRVPRLPVVAPRNSGGVRVEWYAQVGHYLFIDFEPHGEVQVIYAAGSEPQILVDDEVPTDLSALFLQVHGTTRAS
ncbi:hypothetical protein [Euzebya pacifica]|uniref:hypothetical protein n=1 Tax=Euzebya pacifica TaxID=1608957 RepID=UPI0013DF228A|nr:hypothetical protein [Euzebya pacifica]